MIKILIPAAGQSIRYADKGYAIRKPFLTIVDKHGLIDTMLGHVIRRVPDHMEISIGVPRGYTYNDHNDHEPTLVKIENSNSQLETVWQLLENSRTESGILIVDADTIAPIAGMLEFIDYMKPEMAVAVTTQPDEWMGRVSREYEFNEKGPSGEYGIIGMRYFHSSSLLVDLIRNNMTTFSDIMNMYPCDKKLLYFVQWYEDWGSPEKLAAAGASVA
jgi:hypothetical protein